MEMAGITIRELAEAVGGTVCGPDDIIITGAASVKEAVPGDVVLAENVNFLKAAIRSDASAVVSSNCVYEGKPIILAADARNAFSVILRKLAPAVRSPEIGIAPNCSVGERLVSGKDVRIGFGCVIGNDVTIGDGTIIYPLAYIGDGVKIGSQSVLDPNVTVCPGCEIGSGVVIHSGSVIGSDGFGYLQVGNQICKVPQIGKVVIEDDVEIGSNVTIDRAKTGATRIGRGTKIDNLVHIAHNVKIGENCMIVAQVGCAGSAEIGNGVTIAGQVGIKDHVHIGDGVVVGGKAAVFGDLKPGGIYSGYPARPHKDALRAQAALLRLPETQKTVDNLRKEVERLGRRLAQLDGNGFGAESE